VISSNPSDEARASPSPSPRPSPCPSPWGSIRRPGRPGVRSPRRTRPGSSRSTRGPRTGRSPRCCAAEGLYHSHIKERASASDAGALSGL